jgi:DHA1 family tetracycline resistance protein-like MFS transporter
MKKPLILILLYVFVDVLGFSLILPLLPFYASTFDASPSLVGLLLAANAVTQLIGAPLIGRLSDRYGRRPMLLVSIAGTALSFTLLGLANSLWMLFLSRLLDGLLGGNISLAQAYITDVTDEGERAKGLGLVGAAFGIGFIFGPVLGGVLSTGDNFARPALIAAALSLVNLVGVLLFLPESLPPEERSRRAQSPATAPSARALWQALHRPCVGPLLVHRLFYGLAFTAFQTLFSLFVQRRLGFTAQTTSYLFTYVGVLIALVQGVGVGLLTERFSDKRLLFASTVALAGSLLAYAFTPNLWVLLVVVAAVAASSGVLVPVAGSALSKSVSPDEVGGTLGLGAALDGLNRIVAPIAGGALIDALGPSAPGVASALIMAGLIIFTQRRILAVPDDECPPPARGDVASADAELADAAVQ